MRLALDDCSFELRRIMYGSNESIHILLRRNPPSDDQSTEQSDNGRPPIAMHHIDMDLKTSVCKKDVEVLTDQEMMVIREAMTRLLDVPKGQF